MPHTFPPVPPPLHPADAPASRMGRFSLAQIKSIHVEFNASDGRSRAVREFLARCTTPKAIGSNPKCEITHKLRIDEQPPVVALEYGAFCARSDSDATRKPR